MWGKRIRLAIRYRRWVRNAVYLWEGQARHTAPGWAYNIHSASHLRLPEGFANRDLFKYAKTKTVREEQEKRDRKRLSKKEEQTGKKMNKNEDMGGRKEEKW